MPTIPQAGRPSAALLLAVALACTDKGQTNDQKSLTVISVCPEGVMINGVCVKGPSVTGIPRVGSKDPSDTEFWPNPLLGLGPRREPLLPAIELQDRGALLHSETLQKLRPKSSTPAEDLPIVGMVLGTTEGALSGAATAAVTLRGGEAALALGEPGLGGVVLLHGLSVEGEVSALDGVQLLHPEAASGFGLRMAVAGQEGAEVLAVAAPHGSAAEPGGEVWLLAEDVVTSGSIEALAIGRMTGPKPGGRAGASLAAVDADADGIKELAVGGPGAADGAVYLLPSTGLGEILLGEEGTTLYSPGQADFGAQLVVGDDIDEDGHPELIIGAPGKQGAVYIVDAAEALAGSFSWDSQGASLVGLESEGRLGSALSWSSAHGLLVGAPGEAEGAGRLYQLENADLAELISAAATLETHKLPFMLGATGEGLGGAVQADVDLDDDGVDDLIVGSAGADGGGQLSLFVTSAYD